MFCCNFCFKEYHLLKNAKIYINHTNILPIFQKPLCRKICKKIFYLNLKHKFKKPPVIHRHILMYCACLLLNSGGSVWLTNPGGSCMHSGGSWCPRVPSLAKEMLTVWLSPEVNIVQTDELPSFCIRTNHLFSAVLFEEPTDRFKDEERWSCWKLETWRGRTWVCRSQRTIQNSWTLSQVK